MLICSCTFIVLLMCDHYDKNGVVQLFIMIDRVQKKSLWYINSIFKFGNFYFTPFSDFRNAWAIPSNLNSHLGPKFSKHFLHTDQQWLFYIFIEGLTEKKLISGATFGSASPSSASRICIAHIFEIFCSPRFWPFYDSFAILWMPTVSKSGLVRIFF